MITATVGDSALAARLNAMPKAVSQGVARAIARLGRELQDRVRYDKLGGGVLNRRSGRLADSIAVNLTRTGSSFGATLVTDVPYAAIHEYGGTIPAREIKPHGARALAFPWQGGSRFFARVEMPAVRMPERSFLRSALAEMTPEIRTVVEDAVRSAVRSA